MLFILILLPAKIINFAVDITGWLWPKNRYWCSFNGATISLRRGVSYCPLGGDRDFLIKINHCWCFISVQDVTEDSKTVGDPSQSEDGEDESTSLSEPSDERPPMGKVEAVEGKQEVTAAPPLRRVSTSPPPKMPVKLLTRLGSLDSEFIWRPVMKSRVLDCSTSSLWCFSFPGAPSVPVKKSPATLPRNFTLPKDPHGSLLRGRISTPTGSPHLGALHQQLPPSCIIEELHRALATKHRQDRSEARCAASLVQEDETLSCLCLYIFYSVCVGIKCCK